MPSTHEGLPILSCMYNMGYVGSIKCPALANNAMMQNHDHPGNSIYEQGRPALPNGKGEAEKNNAWGSYDDDNDDDDDA